jgi:hypothetical protein
MTVTIHATHGDFTLWQDDQRWGISHATPGYGVSTFGLRCEAMCAWRRITDPDYLAAYLDSVTADGKRIGLSNLTDTLPGGLLADSIFGDTLDRLGRAVELANGGAA